MGSGRGIARVEEYWDWISVSLFLLVTVDMLTTIFASAELGTAAESNPLMRWALRRGIGTLLAINLVAVVLVVAFFYAMLEMLRRTPERLQQPFAFIIELWLALLVVSGFVVLANNLAAVVLGQSLL